MSKKINRKNMVLESHEYPLAEASQALSEIQMRDGLEVVIHDERRRYVGVLSNVVQLSPFFRLSELRENGLTYAFGWQELRDPENPVDCYVL